MYRTINPTEHLIGLSNRILIIPAGSAVVPATNLPRTDRGQDYWLSQLPPEALNDPEVESYFGNIGFLFFSWEVEEFEPLLLPEKSPTPFHVGDVVELVNEGLFISDRSPLNGTRATIVRVVPPGTPIPYAESLTLDKLWYELQMHTVSHIKGRCARNLKLVPAQRTH